MDCDETTGILCVHARAPRYTRRRVSSPPRTVGGDGGGTVAAAARPLYWQKLSRDPNGAAPRASQSQRGGPPPRNVQNTSHPESPGAGARRRRACDCDRRVARQSIRVQCTYRHCVDTTRRSIRVLRRRFSVREFRETIPARGTRG